MFVKGLIWLLIRMDFPKLYVLDNRLDAFYLTNYTPKYATIVAVAIYAFYLVLLTILVIALLLILFVPEQYFNTSNIEH